MKGQRTVGRYRTIDLTLFALMLILSETLIVSAATRWFPNEPYTVSVVAAITAIVMIRWGPWGGLHAALGGVVFCLASHGTAAQYLIYGLGNLAGLGALGLIRLWGAEEIRMDPLKTLGYGLITLLLMQLGRAALALALGAGIGECTGFFTTDVVSLLFTLVILWIARRLDGILENQRHYLLRIAKEQEAEKEDFDEG